MNKDTSFLYSGITSVSNEPKTHKELQRESKERAKQQLKPAAKVILALIESEIAAVKDISTLIINRTSSEQEINTELLARKLYLGHLNSLHSKVKNITKDKK